MILPISRSDPQNPHTRPLSHIRSGTSTFSAGRPLRVGERVQLRCVRERFLRQLRPKPQDAVSGWLGVYCSFQSAEGSRQGEGGATVEVFREMTKSIAQAIQALDDETPLPDGGILSRGQKLGITKACRKGIGEEGPFFRFS